jgi:hypothetical protein
MATVGAVIASSMAEAEAIVAEAAQRLVVATMVVALGYVPVAEQFAPAVVAWSTRAQRFLMPEGRVRAQLIQRQHHMPAHRTHPMQPLLMPPLHTVAADMKATVVRTAVAAVANIGSLLAVK